SRAEVAHLLISDASGEDRLRLAPGTMVDPALQERQGSATVAITQAQEALVEPSVGKPLLKPQRRVEIGIGLRVLAAGHLQDAAIDQRPGAVVDGERLLLERTGAAVDGLVAGVLR